ncbi:MAG TPA: Gfo/Idh/MocA family oxidoreductase [Solirubrobacteraceae bacterium]|nr:Gfo/Idh/MocA family oxidoreductase [Solirubrobacteraceae bacterium]
MTDARRPTRVAVVGAGVWGEQHARVFSAHPDAQLVAIAGRTRERADARARAYRVPAYVDLEAMLERERPDLVTVCLPNEEHFEPTLALLRSGVALLVEKPLVFELEQADALLA